MTIQKGALSASTNFRGIKVVATATLGTTIHTAPSGATTIDYVTITASNPHTADIVLTIEWGGATDPDDLTIATIPSKAGEYLVIDHKPIQNSLVVTAFTDTANELTLFGDVFRTSIDEAF